MRQLSRADLSPMQRGLVDATLANVFKAIADFDGADANGVGPYPMNVVNGVRVNTGMAYPTTPCAAAPTCRIRATRWSTGCPSKLRAVAVPGLRRGASTPAK